MGLSRGIRMELVAQYDGRTISEYGPTDMTIIDGVTQCQGSSIVACYVPYYRGAQVWVKYSVDTPSPDTKYMFQVFHNGEEFTSWACDNQTGYEGRIESVQKGIGPLQAPGFAPFQIVRQALRFRPDEAQNPAPFDDYIEVRAHRVERGGLPNEPYATFRFYYRPKWFLTQMGAEVSPHHSRKSSKSGESSLHSSQEVAAANASPASSTSGKSSGAGVAPTHSTTAWLYHHRLHKYNSVLGHLSLDKIANLTKAEFAASGVATEGARKKLVNEQAELKSLLSVETHSDHQSQAERSAGDRAVNNASAKKNPKCLTVKITGVYFDLEKKKKAILSPFTPGGRIRQLFSPAPASAPARENVPETPIKEGPTEWGPKTAKRQGSVFGNLLRRRNWEV